MIQCLVIGDSLAAGVGRFQQQCETVARVGISSRDYIDQLLGSVSWGAEWAIISLGVNDDPTLATLRNLQEVRSRIHVRHAYWLLPGIKNDVRAIIRLVAAEHGDLLFDTRPMTRSRPDHLHPTAEGYQQIAATIERYDLRMAQRSR